MIDKPRYSHATKVAQKLLKETEQTKPPIDVKKILERLGINLMPYPFPEKVSAVLLKEGQMLVVGVNNQHHPNRQRFSIAHEIGHYCLGHYKDIYVDTQSISEGRFDLGDENHDKTQEQEANHFASEILIPSSLIEKDFKAIRDAEQLAKLYQVSKDALWIKLMKLKLV